jgi:hypothetical protein
MLVAVASMGFPTWRCWKKIYTQHLPAGSYMNFCGSGGIDQLMTAMQEKQVVCLRM